ncbi:MAG: hypothetical protein IKI25_03910 [Bacteroidales bacterium]|nr:hypothetical protein [Bacteroidales bacterium]MBR7034890.1 hypothetical protein [Bacteroidales bacterium]
MKYRLVKIIANVAVMALVFPMSINAQTEENPELQKTIQVYSEYKPQISDASRISVNPKVYDTLDIQMNLKYSVTTTPLNTDYHIIPLKAVSVTGDKLSELYRGEAVVGLGNYWTGLLAVRYMTERSRLKQSGIELYHFGSAGKVKMTKEVKVPAGYSNTYATAYWKRFYEDFTINASIKPFCKTILTYGYDTTYASLINSEDKNSVRSALCGVNASVGIASNDSDEDALRYTANCNYDLYSYNILDLENVLDINGKVEQKFERISLGLSADAQLHALNYEPFDPDSALSKFQSVVRVMPYLKVGANSWNLRVGVNASPLFGGVNTFKIFPDVAFTYGVPDWKIVPFFNLYGNVDLHSMLDIFDDNLYQDDRLVVLRPTINKLGFDLGFDGRLKKLITYNMAFTVRAYDNMYFWTAQRTSQVYYQNVHQMGVTDYPIGKTNTYYTVVYDKATLMKLHGDLGFLFRKMNVGVEANYYKWQAMDSVKYAFYKPIVDVTLSSRFNIIHPKSNKTKLTIEPQLYCMNYQSEMPKGTDFEKKTIVDLGFEAQYYYNSVFEIFLDINNLLSRNNERYLDYPTQRLNFLIGASFSFGGHKE